jgi:hypothetical protein
MKSTALLSMLALLALVCPCLAHPLPDVAVRANFEQNGDWTLQVEIDPRSFQPDPNVAPYLTNADLGVTPAEQQEKLKATAREYVKKAVAVVLDPVAEVKPDLAWEFTAAENAPLKLPEDPVMLTGTWRTKLPAGSTGYSIKALPTGTRTKAPPPITAESLQAADAAMGGADAVCSLCGTDAEGGYMLPTVAAVAGIIVLVVWFRKKRAV